MLNAGVVRQGYFVPGSGTCPFIPSIVVVGEGWVRDNRPNYFGKPTALGADGLGECGAVLEVGLLRRAARVKKEQVKHGDCG